MKILGILKKAGLSKDKIIDLLTFILYGWVQTLTTKNIVALFFIEMLRSFVEYRRSRKLNKIKDIERVKILSIEDKQKDDEVKKNVIS